MERQILPKDKALIPRAREMRANATKQEKHLWYDFLRAVKPRFLRQYIIGEYIVDFYCLEAALAIELDGAQHQTPGAIEYDNIRTAFLNSLGVRVLRFANTEVDYGFQAVCDQIQAKISDPAP